MTSSSAAVLAGLEDASDVTHSTAYTVLNTLVEEGMVLDERANYLKQKFKDLHTRVLTIYKRDNLLLKRARQLRSELDCEREHVQSRGEVAQKDDEEIQKLKRTLVSLEKELNDSQERESILQVEALEYDRRKQNLILEREDAQAAEEARLRPRMESVQGEINEMGNAIKALINEYEELKKSLDQTISDEAACRAEITNFTTTLAQAKQQYTNVEHDPERATKQLELVKRSLLAAQKELAAAEHKAAAQTEMISKLEQQKSSRGTDVTTANNNMCKIKSDIEAKRKTLAALNTSLEMELETRQSYQDRLNELEQLIKTTRISAKQEEDGVERLQREKTRCVKEFVAIEHSCDELTHEQRALKEELLLVQKTIDRTEATRKAVKLQIADEKTKVEVRAKQLLREQSKEKEFTDKANLVLEDIADVTERTTAKALKDEVKRRELLALVSRRQEMNREAAKEGSRAVLAKNEVATKMLQLHELKHRNQELEKRLSSLVESFQNVKRERSHKTALIQTISQKITEVSEKTRILENELEVLVREAAVKEQELIKKKRITHEAQQVVVKLRLEKNKQRKKVEAALDVEKEVRAQVRRLNLDVAATEDVMTNLKDEYVTAIENRNQTGVQLIDRNDTLGLLVEKIKAQELAIEQGTTLTNARAEEVKRLKVLLADLLRGIDVCQKSVPKMKQLEDELERITASIDDERWRMEVLENDLTDPNNPHRWRHLPSQQQKQSNNISSAKKSGGASSTAAGAGGGEGGAAATATTVTTATSRAAAGTDSSSSSAPSDEYLRLQGRTQDLESRLNAISEKLREKELILAEVRELSDRIGSQAESGKEFTLALARHMNQYQGGIRAKTRQMMATISELSLFQASSIQLQQEVERLEDIVREAESRLEEGDAPFAEAEEEFLRQRTSNERYAEALRRRKEDARELALIGPNTVVTTAEPRANAYVPDNDLGLPRPFGAHAPFRPTLQPPPTAVRAPRHTPHSKNTTLTNTHPSHGNGNEVAVSATGHSHSAAGSFLSSARGSQQPQQQHQSSSTKMSGEAGMFSSSLPASARGQATTTATTTGSAGGGAASVPSGSEQLRLSQRNASPRSQL